MLRLVTALAAPQPWKAWKQDLQAPENVAYYGVSSEARVSFGAPYLALAARLAVTTYDVHEMLGGLRHVGRG
jgi:hypothetical protein